MAGDCRGRREVDELVTAAAGVWAPSHAERKAAAMGEAAARLGFRLLWEPGNRLCLIA